MKRHWKKLALGLAVAGVLVGAIAQPAMANYSTYFNADTDQLVEHSSPLVSGITGGRASDNISTADFYINLETFSGYGRGFTLYGAASGTSPGNLYLTHATVTGLAQNGCYWSVGHSGITGQLHMTCAVNK